MSGGMIGGGVGVLGGALGEIIPSIDGEMMNGVILAVAMVVAVGRRAVVMAVVAMDRRAERRVARLRANHVTMEEKQEAMVNIQRMGNTTSTVGANYSRFSISFH